MKRLSLLFLLSPTFLMSTTVTSGQLGPFRYSGGAFNFVGDNFNVKGGLDRGNWGEIFYPAPIGTSVSVNGRISGWDITFGSGIVNGLYYDSLNWGGSYFNFAGPNVIRKPGLVIADFTFTGWLCGYTGNPFGPCTVEVPDLVGSGQVYIDFVIAYPGEASPVTARSLTYVFTPEPSSIALVGIGLGLVALSKSRLRHHTQEVGPRRPSAERHCPHFP